MNQRIRPMLKGGAVTGMLLLVGLLGLSLGHAADKQASKAQKARVIYSGQFKGHVEPCG
ncbi:hypothetical protein KJZ99_10870 [bacterium]|nr:hypothetical protein [bacterium]